MQDRALRRFGATRAQAMGGLALLAELMLSAACGSSAKSGSQRSGSSSGGGQSVDTGVGGVSDDRGVLVGTFVHTYYWMEFETDYPGDADTDLPGTNCRPLARVPKAFADRVCVEGSGRLKSGPLLNLSGNCACGYLCPETSVPVCFFSVTDASARWGYGSDGNPLVPLRSLAVAEDVLPHGTVLYIPEWNGIMIPDSDGIGGFTHDGCFRIDDVGYGVNGRHYDLYTGTVQLWQALEQLRPTDSSTTVYRDPPRCAGKLL